MKRLPPLLTPQQQVKKLEKVLDKFFYEVIFEPIQQGFNNKDLITNDVNKIKTALKEQKIVYSNDKFFGDFSGLTKDFRELGGIYSAQEKSFVLPSIDGDLMTTIANIQEKNIASLKTADNLLVGNLKNLNKIIATIPLEDLFGSLFSDINKNFTNIAKHGLGIDILASEPYLRETLQKEYVEDLTKAIKDFTEEQIRELRETTFKEFLAGNRYDNLAVEIHSKYGVSKSKAEFLAHQETSLITSKFRDVRFQSVGIKKYQWSTSKRPNVRPAHKALEGKIFEFENPPSIEGTNRRCNPGEDYNCFCVAIPVVD